MSKYGYIRVSTDTQSLNRQIDSLSGYGLDRIFEDKKSGKDFERDGYKDMKSVLKHGDEVYIHALDRLGRDKDLVKDEWKWFKDNGVTLRVLNMPTTLIEMDGQEWIMDMINNIILEVLGALAEQERAELIHRTKEGIESARRRGVHLGRKNVDMRLIDKVDELVSDGLSVKDACDKVGVGRSTYYRCRIS